MTRILTAVLLLAGLIPATLAGQDTLPKFSAVLKTQNRVVISWTNPYPIVTQLSIQRSIDSLRNFKTILTVPDPAIPQNGFVDAKSPSPYAFYRILIVLDSGKYQFTRSKRASPDTLTALHPPKEPKQLIITDKQLPDTLTKTIREKQVPPLPKPREEKFFTVKRRDTLIGRLAEKEVKRFRDSILYKTKDTLVLSAGDLFLIRPFVPKEVYKPSKFVYTEKYGNLMIVLPEAESKKYTLRFYEDKGTNGEAKENKDFIFELKQLNSPSLALDKSAFIHAGWFWFELFENDTLKEKNKFYIPKDF
ncbi:MAG: hypothetical protein JNL51_18115 [Chitinophagaceae bacterium]|nr:hypothetical protein [Chitinophagaceae bacterium]